MAVQGRKPTWPPACRRPSARWKGWVPSLHQVSVGRLRGRAIEVVAGRVRNSGYLLGICGAAGLRRRDSAYRFQALDALGLTKRAPTSGCLCTEKEPGNRRLFRARITRLCLSNHCTSVYRLPRWPGVVLPERTARTISERGLGRTEGPFVRRRCVGFGHALVDLNSCCECLEVDNLSGRRTQSRGYVR